jgi:hypothetical protein
VKKKNRLKEKKENEQGHICAIEAREKKRESRPLSQVAVVVEPVHIAAKSGRPTEEPHFLQRQVIVERTSQWSLRSCDGSRSRRDERAKSVAKGRSIAIRIGSGRCGKSEGGAGVARRSGVTRRSGRSEEWAGVTRRNGRSEGGAEVTKREGGSGRRNEGKMASLSCPSGAGMAPSVSSNTTGRRELLTRMVSSVVPLEMVSAGRWLVTNLML